MASDSELTEDASLELEMLAASYEHDILQILGSDGMPLSKKSSHKSACSKVLKFRALPCVGGKPSHIFCAATILLMISNDYPLTPAQFSLQEVCGLDDAEVAEVILGLQELIKIHAVERETHLWQAITHLQDELTRLNHPNDCPVCFEAINLEEKHNNDHIRFDACLHAMHKTCFQPYFDLLKEQRFEKQEKLTYTLGKYMARREAEKGWAYCPICRTCFSSEFIRSLDADDSLSSAVDGKL